MRRAAVGPVAVGDGGRRRRFWERPNAASCPTASGPAASGSASDPASVSAASGARAPSRVSPAPRTAPRRRSPGTRHCLFGCGPLRSMTVWPWRAGVVCESGMSRNQVATSAFRIALRTPTLTTAAPTPSGSDALSAVGPRISGHRQRRRPQQPKPQRGDSLCAIATSWAPAIQQVVRTHSRPLWITIWRLRAEAIEQISQRLNVTRTSRRQLRNQRPDSNRAGMSWATAPKS